DLPRVLGHGADVAVGTDEASAGEAADELGEKHGRSFLPWIERRRAGHNSSPKEANMKSLISFASLVLVAVSARADAPAKPPSTEDGQVSQLADAKWVVPKDPKIPAGVMASPIAVEPGSGASIGYAKIPAGTLFPLHWHSATEYSVLLSGKGTFTI